MDQRERERATNENINERGTKMSDYNVADDFRYFNDAAYRKEVDEKRTLEPTMSNMEPHTVFSNEKITVTVRRISDTEYLRTDVLHGETTEMKLDRHGMFGLFGSPFGYNYKTKWADFPEIQMFACGYDL